MKERPDVFIPSSDGNTVFVAVEEAPGVGENSQDVFGETYVDSDPEGEEVLPRASMGMYTKDFENMGR